ncbi:hypothetical protein [Paenibacillus xanthanilyticus]|uniref:Uncharacterized protein n=1 Tax=Paenibacillus xanthanilyticus TaxID=1783531 RepID=A0ABV8K452_9BACL
MNVKLMVESAIVGTLLYVLGGIVMGMVMTAYFVPDILEAYESPDIRAAYESGQGSSQVSFGGPVNPWLEGMKALLVCAAYYGIRLGIARWRRVKRQRRV